MQFVQSGQGLDVSIPPGQSIAISSITGTYSATLLDGAGRGALASGSSRGATYGPYPSGATVRVTAGNRSRVSFDVGVSPDANASLGAMVKLDEWGDVSEIVDESGLAVAALEPAGIASSAIKWQAKQKINPWSGAIMPTGTAQITEWASSGTSGTIAVDNAVKFGGRPTTRVDFTGTASGTAFEIGVPTAAVRIQGAARGLLSGYVAIAVKATAPVSAAKLYIGDASFANYYEISIVDNAVNAVVDIGDGWRLLIADTTIAGVVALEGTPNLDGLKRMKVTCFCDSNPPAGSAWLGFAGAIPKPKPTVVLTADDGYSEWFNYLFPAMVERGIPGSFSVDAGYIGQAGFMTAAQFTDTLNAHGDLIEFVNHGANNVAYSAGTAALYKQNIRDCDALLGAWGVPAASRKIHTYVQGQYDQALIDWLIEQGYTSAREVGGSNRSQFNIATLLSQPNISRHSRYAIPAGCNLDVSQPVDTVIDYIETAKAKGGAFFIMGHEFKAAPGAQTYVAGYHATHGMSNLLDYLAAERDAGNIDLMKWSQYVDSMSRGEKVVGVS